MFSFNKQSAIASDRIQESGSYDVKIKQAYLSRGKGESQSEALSLDIETPAGTGNISLWYKKADGSENEYAVYAINALMGVLKIRELKVSDGQIDAYDRAQKMMVKRSAEVFGDLAGKKLKMAIQAKWDTYNGKTIVKLELRCPATVEGFTVTEVLNAVTKPEAYQKAIDRLKPIGPRPVQAERTNHYAEPVKTSGNDFDDDIPF